MKPVPIADDPMPPPLPQPPADDLLLSENALDPTPHDDREQPERTPIDRLRSPTPTEVFDSGLRALVWLVAGAALLALAARSHAGPH